jgi:hypothetical protein
MKKLIISLERNPEVIAIILVVLALIGSIFAYVWYCNQPTVKAIKIDKAVRLFRADECRINGGCIQPFECWQEHNTYYRGYATPSTPRCYNYTPRQVLCSDNYYYDIESQHYIYISLNDELNGYHNVNETLDCR